MERPDEPKVFSVAEVSKMLRLNSRVWAIVLPKSIHICNNASHGKKMIWKVSNIGYR